MIAIILVLVLVLYALYSDMDLFKLILSILIAILVACLVVVAIYVVPVEYKVLTSSINLASDVVTALAYCDAAFIITTLSYCVYKLVSS